MPLVGERQTRLTEPGQEQPLQLVALGFEKYPNFAPCYIILRTPTRHLSVKAGRAFTPIRERINS